MKKVSIIVPVYNVEKYIDQCIESICIQTYKNLEIIIVCDESQDGSLLKCEQWAEKDQRINLIINRRRKGLGAARNVGLGAATGKYVVYVDSDDWIKENYIEMLYHAIEKTQANYVESAGFYEVKAEDEINECRTLPCGEYSSDSDKMTILLKDVPSVWKKIYDRNWLVSNGLFQPELFHYEDWGFNIGLITSANKIVLIPEIGVFYRNEREGRLSNDNLKALNLDFRRSIEYGLQKAQQNSILDKYRMSIQKYLLYDYYVRLNQAVEMQDEEALQILNGIKLDILVGRLGYKEKYERERCICFGSFSLRWMVQRTTVFEKIFEYYGFSSVISAVTQGEAMYVVNKNEFRAFQVSQDILGAFGEKLDSIQQKTILLLDFLEERNAILDVGNDQYITESEAYLTSAVRENHNSNILQSGSEEFIDLWKRKCKVLVEKLYLKKNMLKLFLVRNRMALEYGDQSNRKEFEEVWKLRQYNRTICELEEYFLESCRQRDIIVREFDLPKQYCYTEEQFKYGCKPQYMNEVLYTYMGFQIYSEIFS